MRRAEIVTAVLLGILSIYFMWKSGEGPAWDPDATRFANIGMIEGVCAKIIAEHGRPMKVIGTGGLAGLFERGTEVFDHLDGDLTMHGLWLIDQKNKD